VTDEASPRSPLCHVCGQHIRTRAGRATDIGAVGRTPMANLNKNKTTLAYAKPFGFGTVNFSAAVVERLQRGWRALRWN